MTDKHPEWMGKNRKLSPSEIKEFLAEPVVARIATIDENGVPYVTPVWQEWDGEAFWIVPRERAAWIKHIKNNPNVGISCARDSGTYKRVTAQGKAEIIFGPAPMQGHCLDVANRMALRFLGQHGPEYLVPTYDRPRYLIKIVPTKMLTWDERRMGYEIYREITLCRCDPPFGGATATRAGIQATTTKFAHFTSPTRIGSFERPRGKRYLLIWVRMSRIAGLIR